MLTDAYTKIKTLSITPSCRVRSLLLARDQEQGPETTTKLLEKGEGFRTKHASGFNANGDEMVCGLQVCILGLLLLFCLLCHQSRLSGSQGNVGRGQILYTVRRKMSISIIFANFANGAHSRILLFANF